MGFRELIFNYREMGGWGLIRLVLLLFYPVHRQPDNGYGEGGGVGATGWEGRGCLLPLATISRFSFDGHVYRNLFAMKNVKFVIVSDHVIICVLVLDYFWLKSVQSVEMFCFRRISSKNDVRNSGA